MNQRILFVIDSFTDLCEGYFFREVLNSLLRSGIEIRVVLTQPQRMTKNVFRNVTANLPVDVDLAPQRFRHDPGCAAMIRRIAGKFAAPLIHSWGSSAMFVTCLASWGTPWKHVANKFNLFGVRLTDRMALRRAAMVLVNDESVRSLLERNDCGNQVQVLKVGAPLAKFDEVHGTLDGLRDRLELPEDLFLIGARADFLPVNRLKDLLWATDLLQTIRSDFRFLLFGDGPQRWRLERFARQSHADRKTVFVPATENLLPWFRELDLFWHAFEYDPRPFEIAAATRGGCPTLAPRRLGNTGAIRDSINGRLFDVGQRDQIARISNALLNDGEQLKLLQESTFGLAKDHEIQSTTSGLLEVYQKLT